MIHQGHRQTDGLTDGQTTCDSKTTLCTVVHRAVKTSPLKVIWEERVALAQLRNKIPNGYNEMPNIPTFTPKTAPSPSTITTPIYNTLPSTDPTHHSTRHKDSISHFATAHFPDRPTDTHTYRQTDGISDR